MHNEDWIARGRAALWHPCTQMKQLEAAPPLPVARGEGPWLIDYEGRRYLDAISSWWVNLFGHAEPRINAALVDQLTRIEHVILAGCTHAPVVELSERLAALTGLGHAFYGSDGASATEIALKMSFHCWKNLGRPEKTGFVSLAHGYHGETLGALSVTDVALFKDTYAPLLRHTRQVMSPDWRQAGVDQQSGETAEDVARRAAADLEAHLAAHAGTTAAVILEPLVQGAAGMAMYHPLYLTLARELCDRFEVHLIADEIAVGFGRTGTMFACEQAPPPSPGREKGAGGGGDASRVADIADFLCLSKGLTGGYLPLSCVLTTDRVYQAFWDDETARGFLHSHSYTGNPLACRAALAVLDIFEQDGVLAANCIRAARFTDILQGVAAHPRVRHFRHAGMIWAFDVAGAPPGFARDFHRRALARGVFLRPIGATVYYMPPYVVGEEEMALLAAVTQELLDQA
ncbi:MAG: aminotransferase class III-fold pyridoxal phosphate-dependent enzyme [Thiobacillaceae bacterium]|jgi:adenosylmethionine-8-amino-7-oxononanoate aminotransferase|nr:aminotransferase class III-fold pyridoxal phosphate-dependent enzyme [Thiobacillaceae bacterium]